MDVLTLHDAFKRLEDIEDKIEVNIPKKVRKITESYKESDDVKNILDTLGIDASNRTLKNKEQNDKLVSQYRYLCKKYPNASICLAEGYTPKNGTILGESLDLLAVKKEEVIKESVSIKKVGVIKESLKEDEEGNFEGEATVVSGENEEYKDDVYFKYSPSKGTIEIVAYGSVEFEDDEEEVVKEMLCKSLKESDGKEICKIKYTLKKTKNDYDEYVVKCYKDGKFDEEGSYYSDDWDDAVATFKDMSKRANLNVRDASNGFIAECKTITEAPDKYGIPTDDELKKEYHEKKAQARRDRQAAYEDEMAEKETETPEDKYCVVKSKEEFANGVSVKVLFRGTYEECLEWLKEENKALNNKNVNKVEVSITPIKPKIVEVEVDKPEGKVKVKKRKKRSDNFEVTNLNLNEKEFYSITKDTGDFNETLEEDLESVEYKGFTLEPLEIKSIEFGGKSIPGFTKYIIKKGEKLLPDEIYELYRKDHKLETIDDYKDLIDNIQVKEAKESSRKEQRGMTKHRGRKITEGVTVDLMQEDEIEDGKKELEKKDERKEQAEKIVDVDANTIDELKDSYVGNAILQCPVCRTLIYKKPDALKKDDEENVYNKEETCPHCGSLDGYILVGQVATYDTPFEKDEKATTGAPDDEEIKEITKEDPEEETEINELEFESLDKTSFDKLVTDYLTENYSNVKNYTSTKSYTDKNQLFVEGIIEYTNDKKKGTKFVFEGVAHKNNKYRFKGLNEAISKDKAFTLLSKVNEGILNCNILRYKYKALNESIDVRGSVCYRKER